MEEPIDNDRKSAGKIPPLLVQQDKKGRSIVCFDLKNVIINFNFYPIWGSCSICLTSSTSQFQSKLMDTLIIQILYIYLILNYVLKAI